MTFNSDSLIPQNPFKAPANRPIQMLVIIEGARQIPTLADVKHIMGTARTSVTAHMADVPEYRAWCLGSAEIVGYGYDAPVSIPNQDRGEVATAAAAVEFTLICLN